MKSMNRQFGRFMRKGSADPNDTAVMLSDYEEVDKVLSKIIEASKAWRDSWVSILSTQVGTTTTFEELYQPIIGASNGHGQEPVITPLEQIERTSKLKEVYIELKNDLMEEINLIDTRVIRPATDAKGQIQPAKKAIKKRENKRLDWEMYNDRVNGYTKKFNRTDRENVALSKAEDEMAQAANAFKLVDDHLRDILPPIISAAFSILPHLLGVQIMIQNTLLAQYYTALHMYCEEFNFPLTPVEMDGVIEAWQRDFKPAQQRIEAIGCVGRGRAMNHSMTFDKRPSVTGPNIRNGILNPRPSISAKAPSPRLLPPVDAHTQFKPSERTLTPNLPTYEEKSDHKKITSDKLRTDTSLTSPVYTPAGLNGDSSYQKATGKKKPPPPPPKRIGSLKPTIYATAQFPFEAQNDGDLSFRDGDVIKVIKKTDSEDDWWEGELRGLRGTFPANYCKIS
ncbi:hypothetical protein K3495_g6710 [Podosphaera aphanis]|nr:hypothetical protein K3495_g6710 [Podosphaera aphanis]